MTVGEGKFLLYSYITPALKAGDYRFEASQTITAEQGTHDITAPELPVEELHTHVRVTAPRYQLPPDQVLSTFPPAGTEGSYGSRLPQVVIKRRTLPWERRLTGDERTPWLALVLIAEGEAELRLNQDVADCVTPGVHLDGVADVAKGNCLVVRRSVVDKVFPTRKDVPLLAHAREVDIHDTELMMGDDDGFLAVVISNRLPVAGRDAEGNEVPVKYLACLINLEGQLDVLIPQAPPPRDRIQWFGSVRDLYVDAGVFDHVAGGGIASAGLAGVIGTAARAAPPAEHLIVKSQGPKVSAHTSTAGYATPQVRDVYAEMAKDFGRATFVLAEPEYTFPVLLHWSFTSTGEVTFETLMRGLDSGLHGSVPAHHATEGRPPLEVVETGHVGLIQRTRRGDAARCWYRGPLLPHPGSGERLDIAHAGDQLRAVIPDGREDISLATAFEIGRLLALSQPSMVSALLRWRQSRFQAARLHGIWGQLRERLPFELNADIGNLRAVIEGAMRGLIVDAPQEFLGSPRVLVTPGDRVDWGKRPLSALSRGLGLAMDLGEAVRTPADFASASAALRDVGPPVVGKVVFDQRLAGHLQARLDLAADELVSGVIADEISINPALGPTTPRIPGLGEVLVNPDDDAIINLPGGILADPGAEGPR